MSIKKYRRYFGLICISFLWIVFFSSCNSSENLSGDYTFSGKGAGMDYLYHTAYKQNGKMIPCNVVAYAYNDKFIIAAQTPQKSCIVDRPEAQKTGYAINFWIANHSKEELIGPLSFEDYMKERKELQIPDDLTMDVKL